MTPTPPDKDEQTPLSEESLREKIREALLLGLANHTNEFLNPGFIPGMPHEELAKVLEKIMNSRLVERVETLILQERQAWGEQERTAGHRMEAYITWEKYAKQKKRNHLIDLHFADYLHRRFNDLTDQLIEQTGNTNYEHYDYNAETGEVIERNTSGRKD